LSPIANTLIIGKVLYHLENCESTNIYAKQLLAKNKPPDGTVVSTDNQTAGRGQFGNKWHSEPNQNMALSVILFPNLSVNEQFYVSKVASIACIKALKSITNLDFEIKWPNDIYFKNQKVGGVLIENQIAGNKISNSVVGIGINLNQEEFEGLPNATSIYLLVKYLLNRKKCTEILLQHLDAAYVQLRQNNFTAINTSYFNHLKAYQTKFHYRVNGAFKEGVLENVNEQGQLVVRNNGNTFYYNFKEIEWVLS
jgi:BirA family biotin operon repressor/biotin-[acetyl-CoA-carboxylase] ligase